MYSIFSKKFMMVGIVTLTIGSSGVGSSGASPVITTPVPNQSLNWSGYEATGGTFTGVSGTWTVPTVASASGTQADATWVGIGGVNTRDLIQVGTQAVINGSGSPVYQAWYEVLPQPTTQVPVGVLPGDSVSGSLTLISAASGTAPAIWLVTIRNNTTGKSYQTSISYNSSFSSAEWIEEMPRSDSQAVALDNFGSVSFANGLATKNGISLTVAGAAGQPLTMVNNANQTVASVSLLGTDGESFTVTRTSAPNSTAETSRSAGGYTVTTSTGRGWRRTSVDVEGYLPQIEQIGIPVSAFHNQQWLQILQQFRQLLQQIQLRRR